MSHLNIKKIQNSVLMAVSGMFILVIGYLIGTWHSQGKLVSNLDSIKPIRNQESSYRYIYPLLAYNVPSLDQQKDMAVLKSNIQDLITRKNVNHDADKISLYFQDLDKGRWIGINEDEKFTPASLMKVVILAAYLKMSEQDPGLLKKELAYTREVDQLTTQTPFEATSILHLGDSYRIEDLLKRVIIDSDNGAKNLLLSRIDDAALYSVYGALGLPNPSKDPDGFIISPKTYSLFFRILYNATFLNKEMSEKALSILAKTTFHDGLVASLPQGQEIAHKFGEHIVSDNSSQIKAIELHDCGIVYYKPSPYLLCIMTEGQNLDKLKITIGDISKLIYQEMASTNK